jgi:hypothetical protein
MGTYAFAECFLGPLVHKTGHIRLAVEEDALLITYTFGKTKHIPFKDIKEVSRGRWRFPPMPKITITFVEQNKQKTRTLIKGLLNKKDTNQLMQELQGKVPTREE